ncbi:MAG TPA: TIGR02587 family membrane protein [Abditibacteriaceae bacterium]|jgi:putative integral membrane protein (TIGR02587 family)
MNSPGPIAQSLQEYGRGVVGGLVFSLPLLYTMEVWWAGFSIQPERLLCGIAATAALLLGYNFFVGIRNDATFLECAIDSVEEFGLGLVVSAFILWLLGRIAPGMAVSEIAGKIIIEALLVAIGVSVGTAQLGPSSDDDESEPSPDCSGVVRQSVIAACGAFLFAANVAPTEEIVMLASEMKAWQILILALFSLTLGAIILYGADFRSAKTVSPGGNAVEIMSGIARTYAIALLISAAVLWFFGRFDDASFSFAVAQTVVLGFAATLGASAGRLLLQIDSS